MCPQITSILPAVPLCMVKDAQTKVVPKVCVCWGGGGASHKQKLGLQ